MSGGLGAKRVQVSVRAEQRRAEWWQLMVTEVGGRLARVDRGETVAPSDRHVRVWRVLVGHEVQP